MTTAIIVAAGKSERMGENLDKAFVALGSKPVVAWSLLAFQQCPEVNRVILVVRKEKLVAAKGIVSMFGLSKVTQIIPGGARRQDSVARGLEVVEPETTVVVTHDGARPCVTPELVAATVRSARVHGSGIPATRVVDSLKTVDRNGNFNGVVDRANLWAVQTPQAFRAELLTRAYATLAKGKAEVTDDAAAVALLPDAPALHPVEWNKPNLKITIVEDLAIAAALLRIHG
ncbi:MAG: 2-C-methyl-D-erythritol 4-phosphate cytidylyltransferase [Kiritimatiellaeota bacterium]|nr:2-C-methyl-D-erythritol 4-phosphate cytidylyltransferase [Kiritimatiellota bacterium]